MRTKLLLIIVIFVIGACSPMKRTSKGIVYKEQYKRIKANLRHDCKY